MVLDLLSNHRAVVWTAVFSSAVTLGATLAYQAYVSGSGKKPQKPIAGPVKDVPEDVINEQLARNRAFLGDEAMSKIRKSFVIVVGAGGVGSWAATMLVRSGVGRVRIIDFDQVSLSSLNRHACATQADVGTSKVDCIAKYLSSVAPFVQMEPVTALWNMDCAAELLEGNPDFVIDAIDNIDTKVDLLTYCNKNGLPVISAMGADVKLILLVCGWRISVPQLRIPCRAPREEDYELEAFPLVFLWCSPLKSQEKIKLKSCL